MLIHFPMQMIFLIQYFDYCMTKPLIANKGGMVFMLHRYRCGTQIEYIATWL